ncbi:MAG: CPBP family intramembrane glutamic endopeptidase, partial [Promethearchaeota archaeon]
ITFILVIPMFFGVYTDFFWGREVELNIILFLMLGFFLLLLIGGVINNHCFNETDIKLMRLHNVVDALINRNIVILWFFFPITMIMEELIFRYYLISFLALTLKIKIITSIFISSLAFSLYHIHTWFSYKSQKILLINLGYTLILGLYNGYIFFTLGLIPCIIIHYLIAFYLYYNLYRKNFKMYENT